MKTKGARTYTEKENNYITRFKDLLTVEELASDLGRSPVSVRERLRRTGQLKGRLLQRREFSRGEDCFLLKMYRSKPLDWIAKQLNRGKMTVQERLRLLGGHPNDVEDDVIDRLVDYIGLFGKLNVAAAASYTGLEERLIVKATRGLGLQDLPPEDAVRLLQAKKTGLTNWQIRAIEDEKQYIPALIMELEAGKFDAKEFAAVTGMGQRRLRTMLKPYQDGDLLENLRAKVEAEQW